jgi:hypothetical protein
MEDGVNWMLLTSLIYWDDVLGQIQVPAAFITDGGSIPGFFQGFVNPYGKGFRAFVVHDHLYATQKFTRAQADDCLRRALRVCGENMLDSDTQFNAVRFGGEVAWKEDQKKYGLPGGDHGGPTTDTAPGNAGG